MKLQDIIYNIQEKIFWRDVLRQNPCGEIPLRPEGAFQYEVSVRENLSKELEKLDYWVWDDEDDNDLGSFCNDAKFMITAGQLRGLLDEIRESHN